MSRTILQNARVCAALFTGPMREDGGDRTMVQIEVIDANEIIAMRLDDFREVAVQVASATHEGTDE